MKFSLCHNFQIAQLDKSCATVKSMINITVSVYILHLWSDLNSGPEKPGPTSLKCGLARPGSGKCCWCKSIKSGPAGGSTFEVHSDCH